MICEERIWFRFEIAGFVLSFKCDEKLGHEGPHQTRSTQRRINPEDGLCGDMLYYHLTWNKPRSNLDVLRRNAKKAKEASISATFKG